VTDPTVETGPCAVDQGAFPRLAVLLCTHNGERFLAEQLDSLRRQRYEPACVYVHDWGSSDGTVEILRRHVAAAAGGVAWRSSVHAEAPGPARSFLRATDACLASDVPFDYLLFCDQDDIWHADKLQRMAEVIRDQPGVQLVYSDVEVIDAEGRTVASSYLGAGGVFGRAMDVHHASTMFVCTVSGMSMAVSRALLQRGRPLWLLPQCHAHDWTMLIVACLTRAPVTFIDEPLVRYRQHGANLVGSAAGARGRRRSVASAWLQAGAFVRAVHRQYAACADAADSLGVPPLPGPVGRWRVAWTVLRGRSLPVLRRLKVALGYACFWPGRP